ncbi:hypothetical protein BH10CYA1_BH10CYA1_41310 [soil metagenome]
MPKRVIKLLLIEDNPMDAELISEYLDECPYATFEVESVSRLKPGLDRVARGQIDVVLLDMNLPDSSGIDTLKAALAVATSTPIVVLSGLNDAVTGVEAVQCGAQDYVVKGQVNTDSLFRVLRYAIERKHLEAQANQRLREAQDAESRLAAALGSMSEGFCQLDIDGKPAYINAAAIKILGYSHEELMDKNIHDVVHPRMRNGDNRPLQGCAMCDAIKSGVHCWNDQDYFITTHNQYIPVEYSISPFALQGKINGSVLCFRDISERKLEEVRVREFYSTVSHELRTPLTSIRGALSLIEAGMTGPISPETLEMVSIAHESSRRLIAIINDILDLRKIEENEFKLAYAEIDASHVVKATLDGVRGMASEQGVQLVNEANQSYFLIADEPRLVQVTTNLVSNAVKFSNAGGLVSVQVAKTDSDCLRFSITDQGMGIPDNQLHKLFVRFRQIDSSDTRQTGGTGLGLAISKSIVEQHGGKIGVSSIPGVGSTFWFEIPIAVPQWKLHESNAMATVVVA